MDTFDAYFPYAEYRPNQRSMLQFVSQVARSGGIAMIDAPDGKWEIERCCLAPCGT